MSQPGYHPICVLFQGNDCAFDGTYRLVCRHQIRQKDFQPGDNVEVSMGEEDDNDVKVTDQDDDDDDDVRVVSENQDGRQWRDAIALGDEMVMLLLRNMCKNQPAGKSPWGLDKQTKRKRDPGEFETVHMEKRIKTEECTTSQGNPEKVQDFQSRHLLQTILSAVQSVQTTQDHVISKICNIQDHQHQLSNQVVAIQKTLYHLEENLLASNCKADELDSFPTPVSLHHSRPGTSSTLNLNVRTDCPGALQSPASPVQSTSSTNSLSRIVISSPVSQANATVFPSSQEALDPGPSTLPPLYPIEGTLYSPPQVPYNFRFTDETETQVFLGYRNSPLKISKNDMEDILFKTNTPPAYAYRLAGKIFTKEELLNSNTSGKGNRRSGKDFQQLNLKYVDIILMETESRFPTCRNSKEGNRKLLGAINERCRNERKKLIYRYENRIPRNMAPANADTVGSQVQN